jgi:hypothetical protein
VTTTIPANRFADRSLFLAALHFQAVGRIAPGRFFFVQFRFPAAGRA